MPIDFPTYEEIVNRARNDLANQLPDVDPTIFGSFARAFADSLSGRAYDLTLLQQQLIRQLLPQTAQSEFLERWAGYEGITRNSATGASGFVNFTGTGGVSVPAGTQVVHSSGETYLTQSSVTLAAQSINVSSITRSGSTVTATTTSAHSLASGMPITIAGAVETAYNGTFEVTVTAPDEFIYTISGTPSSPATGTITAGYTGAQAEIESENTGRDTNLTTGSFVTLVSPIAGVDQKANAQYAGVSGGSDAETDAELLVRVLQSRSNPVANFNEAAIEKEARAVAGVTRVLVKRITPNVGDVTVLFVRDNDANIIPDAGEIADVYAAVTAISPANTSLSDIYVLAPTPVTTNYAFTAINPDTESMRDAIETNLEAFYRDSVTFEENITEDKYRAAIIDTVDPETGSELLSFTLSGPTGDITVGTNSIGVLGSVTFP